MKETRTVGGTWDLTACRFKLNTNGYELLKKGMKDKKIHNAVEENFLKTSTGIGE